MTSETIERENRAAAPPAEVTVLGEDRWRESYDLFMAALHRGPASDERWAQVRALYHPGQVHGAFEPGVPDSPLIGTIMSIPLRVALPGGAAVPAAGGTFAGVRSGATRRGVLSRMFRARMNDLVDRGEVFLVVRPATADLWNRWGTGPVARSQHLRIDRLHSGARADLAERRNHARPVPPGSDLLGVLPEIQRRAAAGHPGTVVRSDAWWSCWNPYATPAGYIHTALAGPLDSPDGYVTWYVEHQGQDLADARRTLHVVELFAGSAATATDLWIYLLHLELVEEIRTRGRPLDEEVPLLLANQRACSVGPVFDELWMRVIDVPAALHQRLWAPTAGESVVLEVVDDYLPHNSGCYRISSSGTERVSTSHPDLTCAVNQLSTMYLGDRSPSQLAAAGLLEVHDRTSVPRADRLFAVEAAPWGGSMF